MNLHKLIFTKNACYQAGQKITVKGIMVHSTGANNPNLKRYVGPDDGLLGKNAYGNHWNTYMPGGGKVCVHGFIGKLADGSIASYQTLPWNHRGWHAGGSANNTHIGFEICEDGLTDRTYFEKVYKEAVELCAYLCEEFNLNPLADGVLICHSEGAKRGIASSHSDVMHWFPKHGKDMDDFRADVKAAMSGKVPEAPTQSNKDQIYRVRRSWADAKTQLGAFRNLESAKKMADENAGYKVFDEDGGVVYIPASETNYKVKVTADVLNVRSGAGTIYKINMRIKKGEVYTIVAEDNGWGKLKSGAGWICLAYTTEV